MRPTDEYYNTKADAKKKKPGLVPSADITPPVQPDWRAGIEGGGAQNPGLVEPAAGNTDALRHQIELKRRMQQLGSDQGMIVGSPSTGLSLGDKLARAEAIRTRGNQLDDIRGALAPVQKVQSLSQIAGARNDLQDQGLKVLLQQREEITRRMNADRENAPKYQEELNQNADAMHQMQARLPKITGDSPQAVSVLNGQQALQRAQMDRRTVYAGNAASDLAGEQARIAQQNAIADKTQKFRETELDAGIAQNSPEAIKAEMDTKNAIARGQAMQARASAGRQAAGFPTEESYANFESKATSEIGAADYESFTRGTVAQLRSLAESSPEEAARIASGLITAIDQQRPNAVLSGLADTMAPGVGSFRRVKAARLEAMKQALMGFMR